MCKIFYQFKWNVDRWFMKRVCCIWNNFCKYLIFIGFFSGLVLGRPWKFVIRDKVGGFKQQIFSVSLIVLKPVIFPFHKMFKYFRAPAIFFICLSVNFLHFPQPQNLQGGQGAVKSMNLFYWTLVRIKLPISQDGFANVLVIWIIWIHMQTVLRVFFSKNGRNIVGKIKIKFLRKW